MATPEDRALRLSLNESARRSGSIGPISGAYTAATGKGTASHGNSIIIRIATGMAIVWPDNRITCSPGASARIRTELGL